MNLKTHQKQRLSSPLIYSYVKHNSNKPVSGSGTVMGIVIIAIIGFVLVWRYQQKQAEILLLKDNPKNSTDTNVWNTQNKMLELQRREEKAQQELNDYYMNNMNPQQKVQYILKQNNPQDVESYINEGIAQRAARTRYN